MTRDRDFKKQVRARAAQTGEPYTAARDALRPPEPFRPIAGGSAPSKAEVEAFAKTFADVVANIEQVVRGKHDVVTLVVAAAVADGHVLFTDVPGTGRTVLARALAQSIGGTASRIHGTPDLEPADLLGRVGPDGEFQPGWLFANVALVDNLDRLAPRTAVALMEAMSTRAVSSGGVTYELPKPFVLVGSRHPVPGRGTEPLDEALLDKFLLGLMMGYLTAEHERELAKQAAWQGIPVDSLPQILDAAGLEKMRQVASAVAMPDDVASYAVDLVQRTRQDDGAVVGASPRATIAIRKVAAVLAASDGRTEITAQDVRAIAAPAIAHRIVLAESDEPAWSGGRAVVTRALEATR